MKNLDTKTINTIRILSAEAIQKANSGHPGLPLGAAPMAYTLWAKNMKHNPKNPNWINRDRFVLSAGHGSMLIYSLLHLFNYGLTMEDLKNFRQWGSKTPGHPEYGHTVGVETTTGPLGQGIANAVGMAMAEEYLAEKFNKPGYELMNHYTYALVGDGCLMEGISSEAASLAGTLGLDKLIVLYDSNNITIEGNTDIAFTEDVAGRFKAYNWQVISVEDGNDVEAIDEAIKEAKADKERPSIVIIKTEIGYGCPAKQGKSSAHGEPLGEDNLKTTREFLKWTDEEEFFVPKEVREYMSKKVEELSKEEDKWNKLKEEYDNKYPELSKEWELWFSGKIEKDLLNDEDFWKFEKKMATRAASGEVINRLADAVPNLIGGSADLAPSNKTYMKNRGDFSKENRKGSNLHFGVREHAMAAIANGMYLHGGLKVFVSTFFVFSDYMKPSMRLSALMNLPITYVLTHDSIGVGEDGPTHEPIEQLASLRSIPNMTVFRPADAKETAAAWYYAITKEDGPVSLVLSRQNLPLYDETGKDALKGAYILKDAEDKKPDIILMATGSEVELIYEGAKVLEEKGIKVRVVSMPSLELFEKQSKEYKEEVLPSNVTKRLAVEAASSFGWHKYLGFDGDILSIDHFGASAPGDVLFKEFGFTVENLVKKAEEVLNK
ncbi:transketolase [Clostridium cochlearium]|jgi:transketolase|uniref:Transketolase n=1 Tax=Clostridium cochlearium TaxID=1494 RepID=A0A1G9I995_CLOCO|nr:transketolase [Clostridium cochlearium]MBE6064383.1 transketolase [Clostridium cochlearium]MBU5268829.1 transketolase [Clostridium cochlearium]NMA57314.1 transketolase [Clostridium cochlearium]NOH14940.1 transketolase [Clostridium cochlearium]SDL21830.1 transketolase [Clostridium cochlearium]